MAKYGENKMLAGRGARRTEGQDPIEPLKKGAIGASKAIVNGVMGGSIGGAVGAGIKKVGNIAKDAASTVMSAPAVIKSNNKIKEDTKDYEALNQLNTLKKTPGAIKNALKPDVDNTPIKDFPATDTGKSLYRAAGLIVDNKRKNVAKKMK